MGGARRAAKIQADIAGTSWRWTRALAKGGMGEVHVVEHVHLGTPGVLKVIRDDIEDAGNLAGRLRGEARLLKRLVHENLVGILDFGVTRSGRAFLVSELLDGETLGDRLRRERVLPEALAIDVALQTLAGLAVAHASGLVHRDVKPDNVFLCGPIGGSSPKVKILDFGVAKIVSEEARSAAGPGIVPTTAGVMVGTPFYMAPEQIMAEPIDARADIYAMGCMLFRILVGEPPFTGSRQLDIIQGHIVDAPEAPHVVAKQPVSKALSDVVLRALAKAKEDRFASAAEMDAALRAISVAARGSEPARVARTERIGIADAGHLGSAAERRDNREPDARGTYTTFVAPVARAGDPFAGGAVGGGDLDRSAARRRKEPARGYTRPMAAIRTGDPSGSLDDADDAPTAIDARPNLAASAGANDWNPRRLRLALTIAIAIACLLGAALVWALVRSGAAR